MCNKMTKPIFSVNQYDSDGDIVEEGIWLHFGDTIVKVAIDVDDYQGFIDHLKCMKREIKEYF